MPHVESTKRQRKILREEERPTPYEIAEIERMRPRVRSDCIDGPRPCPWISCRFHLGVDVKPGGGITINYDTEDTPAGDGSAKQPSCVLDLADAGTMTLEAVGVLLGVSRERVRQLEVRALRKLSERVSVEDLRGWSTEVGND